MMDTEIDQEQLYQLFKLTDKRTQYEVVRTLKERRRSYENPTPDELAEEVENLKKQVKSWQDLYNSEVKLHITDNEIRIRIIQEQQKQIEKLKRQSRK